MLKRSDEPNNIAEDKGINGAVTQTNVVGSEVVKEGDKGVNVAVTQTNDVGSEVVKEGDVDLVDTETGQVLRATEMLDVTMPETLSEEQKLKVRTAVAQGETLMNALQGAVPEDVRGKVTSSVTAILQKQKKNSNGVPSVSNFSGVTSAELNPKIQETSEVSIREREPNASELNKRDTGSAEDSNNLSTKNDASEPQAPTVGTGDSSQDQSTSQEREPNSSELNKGDTSSAEESNEPSTKNDTSEPQAPTLGTGDTSKVQSTSHHDGEISSSVTKNHGELGSGNLKASHLDESHSVPPGKLERSGNSEDHTSEHAKLGHEDGTKVEKDNQQKDAQHCSEE